MMGLDKLRVVTPRRPGVAWFDMINADFRQREETRRFNYSFRFRSQIEVDHISQTAEVNISTKKGVSPQYAVGLNFIAPGGAQPPMTWFETNPNNYEGGWNEVEETAEEIFTLENLPDLKLTRLDLNADIDGVSVHYFRDSLRIARKRTNNEEVRGQDWRRNDVETFYLGKNPARLRVYDKIQELKFRGEETKQLPDTVTRLEWELRGVRCPIEQFLDVPNKLQDQRPFAAMELTECPDYYDFKIDPKRSVALLTYRELAKREGAQQARKYLNSQRNFSRAYKEILINNDALKLRIEESFRRSNARLLSGRGASITHMYLKCGWCPEDAQNVCQGCGVRLCAACEELKEGHDETCPIRKEQF